MPSHIMACHSYHSMSEHSMSYHVISYHGMSYHIMSWHGIAYHCMSYHVILPRNGLGGVLAAFPFGAGALVPHTCTNDVVSARWLHGSAWLARCFDKQSYRCWVPAQSATCVSSWANPWSNWLAAAFRELQHTPRHVISCHVMSYHVMSYHIIACQIIS